MAISWWSGADGLDAHDRARPTLVELAGGVQEPRAEAEAHRDAEAVAQRHARRLEHVGLVVARDRRTPAGRGGRPAAPAPSRSPIGWTGTSTPPSVEHLAGGRLGRRDVGLVERLHAERGPGQRGGQLEGHHGVPDLGLRRADAESGTTGWPAAASSSSGVVR